MAPQLVSAPTVVRSTRHSIRKKPATVAYSTPKHGCAQAGHTRCWQEEGTCAHGCACCSMRPHSIGVNFAGRPHNHICWCVQLEEFRRKKAAAAAAKQQAAAGGRSAAAQPSSAPQTPAVSPAKATAPPIVQPAHPAASPVRRPGPSPEAAAAPTAPQPAQPFPSAVQQRPPAYGDATATGAQATDAPGRTNGAAGQTADHAAASTQTLAVNPLFSENRHAEDGRGQPRSDGAAASPGLVELQRAYGNQVS